MTRPILHDYYRSSAAYRVRIALGLKGVDYDHHIVNLAHGDQKSAAFRAQQPARADPLPRDRRPVPDPEPRDLRLSRRQVRSRAVRPQRPGRPRPRPRARADRRVRHPPAQQSAHPQISHRRARRRGAGQGRLVPPLGDARASPRSKRSPRPRAGAFLFGDSPTLADICLVPQLYNARRFAVPLDAFPTLRRADETAGANPAFAAAHPDRQEQAP